MPYEAKYNCSDCNHAFIVITESRPRGRCPSCPECKKNDYPTLRSSTKTSRVYTQEELDANTKHIIDNQIAPTIVGSNFTKAMDMTAKMVMQDYGMTNLKDNLRPGDAMVPKLDGRDVSGIQLEDRVTQVFKPQKNNVIGTQAASNLNSALMSQVQAGKFKNYGGANDVVARQQESGIRVPTKILYEHSEKPH